MKKITMMDNLTLYVRKNEYKIEIDEKFTKVSSLDEIEELEQSLSGFLDVDSISKEENKIYLVYNVPEGYEPLDSAKEYLPVVKLQLIKSLLETDPLFESNGMTFLDSNNIFFKNFNDVKLLYRSNGFLPFHRDLDILDQYKLFIMGFYSYKYSYKRYLVNKDNLLRKENNEFLFSINAATTFSELKSIVDEELEKQQTNFYHKAQVKEIGRKKGFKRKIIFGTIGSLLIILLFVGGIKQVEKNMEAKFEEELATSAAENELIVAITSGDTKRAIELMETKGEDKYSIAKMLVTAGQYDEAIAYDNTIEKEVVSRLYEINQEERLLDLKSESDFLTVEKDIVEFDLEKLIGSISLIEDKDTLKRLSLAFMKNKEFDYAKDTLERLRTDSADEFNLSKDEISEIEQYIEMAELEIQIKSLNDQISDLKSQEDLFEEEEEKQKREVEIRELENELSDLQKQLIKIEEKLGMDA